MAVDVLTDFFLQTFFKVCGFLRRYEFRYEMEQVEFTVWPENHLGQRKSIACSVNESRISKNLFDSFKVLFNLYSSIILGNGKLLAMLIVPK